MKRTLIFLILSAMTVSAAGCGQNKEASEAASASAEAEKAPAENLTKSPFIRLFEIPQSKMSENGAD